MPGKLFSAAGGIFLGSAPGWYKLAIVLCLILNPVLMELLGPFVTGWVLIGEFIFTLAMALSCYPLPPGGLLALQAVVLGLTSPESVYREVQMNLPVILLLVFMVASIHFMRDFLRQSFTRILLAVRSKVALSLVFCSVAAVLSAFLDALTVLAVIISVGYGFYDLYHRHASGKGREEHHDCTDDKCVVELHREDLTGFRLFLRNLMMHAAVGTALGGVATIVGEPQNLLIGSLMGWHFGEFFMRTAPVSLPVLGVGLATCWGLERYRLFGYGHELPEVVRVVLANQARADEVGRSSRSRMSITLQAVVGAALAVGLGLHVAEVGLIGLATIVLLTALTGVTEEHRIGRAFEEALPFTALLVVFFAVVSVIHDQHLFKPVIELVLGLEGGARLVAIFLASGVLSMISDNVFVATVYMTEVMEAFQAGVVDRQALEGLAVVINAGTNIPSIATPNGQAAFLFLLTSTLAPLIRLSYGRMVLLALPYTVTLGVTSFLAVLAMR